MSAEALTRLGESTTDAVLGVLEMFAPGKVAAGGLDVDGDPFAGLPSPAVAISVSYVDGVTGGNVFVITLAGARRLAAAMMGMDGPEPPEADELSELELSAVAEAANQMMASAAGATSSVLGTEVEIGPPETRTLTGDTTAAELYPKTPHALRAGFTVCDEPCRLVQLIPSAFVIRMTRALDELGMELPGADAQAGEAQAAPPAHPSLAGISVRVWAELGRARLESAELVRLPGGAVVQLDREADEPIDLYVNGTPFATGRLLVEPSGEWAVRIETLLNTQRPDNDEEVARWPESW